MIPTPFTCTWFDSRSWIAARSDAFLAYMYHQQITYTGNAIPPNPNEAGWKDTVQTSPGGSTRIIVKFDGYTGRYVWHCHILEHEDNEMMRPYEVIAPARQANE